MTRWLLALVVISPVALAGAERLEAVIANGLAQGLYPGAVVLVLREGEVVFHGAYGDALRYAPQELPEHARLPVQLDTIFDLASLTKLFTAWAVVDLANEGLLTLEAPVTQYLPEFAHPTVTLAQLLTHRSGLPAWLPLSSLDTPQARREAVLAAPLMAAPGSERRYSDLGYMVLGWVVEAVSGTPLDAYLKARLFVPLGMTQTRFTPPAAWRVRIAATEVQPATGREPVWGEVHDENAWALGGVAGHAGLFSTAGDLARFADYMMAAALEGNEATLWAGWEQGAAWMGGLGATAYGHTGFTGTSLLVDPNRDLALIALTNRIHPSRDGNLQPWRRALADALAALIGEE